MVVFQKNHVEQTNTMVYSTTDFHCHFFEDAHTGSCLTGVEHTGICSFQYLCVFAGHGCDAAHTLHHVQHQTFGLKQRLHFSFHYHCYVARFHFCSVVDKHFHFHSGVEAVEDFFGNFDTCQYAGFFDKQF